MSESSSLLNLELLSTSAIILIYPDGTYEAVPLDLLQNLNHIDYFKILAHSSERFRIIFQKFSKLLMFYGPLVKENAKNGIVTILNWKLGLQEDILPYLVSYLPENNSSLQELILQPIILYDYTKKMILQYDSIKNDFVNANIYASGLSK